MLYAVYQVRTWSELWLALTEPSAAATVYLAALQLRLSSTRNVEENVLGILIEAGLSSQELAKAQRALEVFLDLIQREKNLWEAIESLESDNYETFKKALYSFLRRDTKPEDVRRAVRVLVELRKNPSLKTKRGSYMVTVSKGYRR
jgi:CHAD domain-containing protein